MNDITNFGEDNALNVAKAGFEASKSLTDNLPKMDNWAQRIFATAALTLAIGTVVVKIKNTTGV